MMLESDGLEQNGHGSLMESTERGRRSSSSPRLADLYIPKNRSTGNLLAQRAADRPRIRFSFDAGLSAAEYEAITMSPVMTEHEHGLGASGLRRIRQQPPPRTPALATSASSSRTASLGPLTGSMSLPLSSSRHGSSGAMTLGPASPALNFTEDLTRFPSESLHSFSFAHQSEGFIHNRQNVLKRSIEFVKDRLGWAVSNTSIASAQARVSGDQETQSMLELLARAKLVDSEGAGGHGLGLLQGPWTGPAQIEADNVFDRSFYPQSSSPDSYQPPPSPLSTKKPVDLPSQPIDETPEHNLTLDSEMQQTPAKDAGSEASSRTPTDESRTTAKTSPPHTRRQSIKRTLTDTEPLALQNKIMDAMAQPYITSDRSYNGQGPLLSPTLSQFPASSSFGVIGPHTISPSVHGHTNRWAPAAQAIFTTDSKAPWTILAANDLACLVFGVTKAEVRRMGILEVVVEERRAWLEDKLRQPGPESISEPSNPPLEQTKSQQTSPVSTTSFLLGRGGLTASLLSKAPSRVTNQRRAQTGDAAGASLASRKKAPKSGANHNNNKSRGVLLCGDVVPIQKRNGATGSASLWVKEKRGGLIWVLEEIHEDVAYISIDDESIITKMSGSTQPIWGDQNRIGKDIGRLLPRLPRQGIDPRTGEIDYAEVRKRKYFTATNAHGVNIPTAVEKAATSTDLRVSSFPHIAGIIVLSPQSLEIASANSVFAAALFGLEKPDGLMITELIPGFDSILRILTDEDGIRLADGIVIPEQSFRRARALLALREGRQDAAAYFLRPDGLPAKHRDGSEIKIDVQMRVVKSDKHPPTTYHEQVIVEEDDSAVIEGSSASEVVYALWITYSRHIHSTNQDMTSTDPLQSEPETPLRQPSPGQTQRGPLTMEIDSDEPKQERSHASALTQQLKAAAIKTAAKLTGMEMPSRQVEKAPLPPVLEPVHKKNIDDFVILENMGQGAYGQVKLARYKQSGSKVVLKYVTKRRILVDTWTRDRRLGTVPLEIHVLDYLRRDGLKHCNIVEMADFFEDDVNYYIEMVPHGLPSKDLFDYIELKKNMQEAECRSIFIQVAKAVHHLHTKALVVHRDIKDENVVRDEEGNIKLIDFGSAAYIRNGPFDVFVGTIDYAAPEVLAGKPYRGKDQDVWALGILLYTIIYKENPFYSIDEIMDRDLRVPYIMSDDSIDLIRQMLDRDVRRRIDIEGVLEHSWLADYTDHASEQGN